MTYNCFLLVYCTTQGDFGQAKRSPRPPISLTVTLSLQLLLARRTNRYLKHASIISWLSDNPFIRVLSCSSSKEALIPRETRVNGLKCYPGGTVFTLSFRTQNSEPIV